MSDAENNNDSSCESESEHEFQIRKGLVEIQAKTVVGDKSSSFFVRPSQLKEVNGKLFLSLGGRKSSTRRLLTYFADVKPKRLHDVLRRTNVVSTMLKLKNTELKRLIVGSNTSASKVFRTRLKMYTKNKLIISEVITINAPQVNDVPATTISVLATPQKGKSCGVWMELCSANLEYVGKAIASQYASGGVNAGHNAAGDDEAVDHNIEDQEDGDMEVEDDEDPEVIDEDEQLVDPVTPSKVESEPTPSSASSSTPTPVVLEKRQSSLLQFVKKS